MCDGVTRTTNWTNTSGMTIYMRTLELRQVVDASFTSVDVLATVWVVRGGVTEVIMAENWKGRPFGFSSSDTGIRTVNISLTPDYVAVGRLAMTSLRSALCAVHSPNC